MKCLCLSYFVAKTGEKKVYLSLSICFCLHLFGRYLFVCSTAPIYAYACTVVVPFILQLFQVCVDVVLDVTTS